MADGCRRLRLCWSCPLLAAAGAAVRIEACCALEWSVSASEVIELWRVGSGDCGDSGSEGRRREREAAGGRMSRQLQCTAVANSSGGVRAAKESVVSPHTCHTWSICVRQYACTCMLCHVRASAGRSDRARAGSCAAASGGGGGQLRRFPTDSTRVESLASVPCQQTNGLESS